MKSPAVEAMWAAFSSVDNLESEYTAWAFGDESRPDLATKLGLLVRDGPKRATAGLLSEYEDEGEPLPEIGDYSVILDGGGDPLCIIRTTEIHIRPFDEVDEQFAWDEGEGDRTLKWWKEAHIRFFQHLGIDIDNDTLMVLERFEVVHK